MNNSLKTKPVSEIRMLIETFEDLQFNICGDEYFKALMKLIENGFSLSFYRSGNSEKIILIKTTEDLLHFKRNIQGY